MAYIPRLTIPESGNPYYNTIESGGYNPCIVGDYPINASGKDRTGYPGLNVYPNCVGHTVGRFNEIIGKGDCSYLGSINAELFFSRFPKAQGLQTGTTPKLGAVICWQKGKATSGSDGAGHVAIVEKVINANSIVTSESGWGAKSPFWTKARTNNNGRWGQVADYKFQGFIYNPAVIFEICPYNEPNKVVKYGSFGNGVRWVQWHLNWQNYGLIVDGICGKMSDAAIRDFQKKHGLEDDGIVGPLTRSALVGALPWNC